MTRKTTPPHPASSRSIRPTHPSPPLVLPPAVYRKVDWQADRITRVLGLPRDQTDDIAGELNLRLASALDELPDTSAIGARSTPGGQIDGCQTRVGADDDHQHQHNMTKTGRKAASDCESVRRPPKNKARTKSLIFRDFCEPVRSDTRLFVNAEGRTRTADLRVMKPILSQGRATPKRLDLREYSALSHGSQAGIVRSSHTRFWTRQRG